MSDTSGEGNLAVTSPPEGSSAVGDGAHAASSPARRTAGPNWRQRLEITLLAGPAILMFITFVMFPVVLAAYYGFFKWKGFGPPTDFVGLQNYVQILQDPTFHDALRHNLVIVVLSLVLQGPAAVLLALLLNQKMRGRSLVRVLIFVPYVISEVIVGTGWSLMLQTNGAVNDLLIKIGLPDWTVDWLSDPKIAMWSLMMIITWKYIGFAVILFLAGLQSIPEELFEAAAIDGASYWQTQRRITLPLLGPDDPDLGVPVDHRSAAAVRPRLHHLGPVRGRDGGDLDDGHLHGGQRSQRGELRVRQRGRRGPVHHLAHRRPDLPAVRAAARHRGCSHGR